MRVPDLDPPKEAGERCKHLCSRGCRIYATRPASCRDFNCLWKQGALPEAWKPNRIGVVFVPNEPGKKPMLLGHVDPAAPEKWRLVEADLLKVAHGLPVVLGVNGRPQWIIHMEDVKEREG
jgi:hypothetical protein